MCRFELLVLRRTKHWDFVGRVVGLIGQKFKNFNSSWLQTKIRLFERDTNPINVIKNLKINYFQKKISKLFFVLVKTKKKKLK